MAGLLLHFLSLWRNSLSTSDWGWRLLDSRREEQPRRTKPFQILLVEHLWSWGFEPHSIVGMEEWAVTELKLGKADVWGWHQPLETAEWRWEIQETAESEEGRLTGVAEWDLSLDQEGTWLRKNCEPGWLLSWSDEGEDSTRKPNWDEEEGRLLPLPLPIYMPKERLRTTMGNEFANGSNSEGSRKITRNFLGLGGIVMATFNADGESWEATEIHWLCSCGCDGISGRLIHLRNVAAQREGGLYPLAIHIRFS